MYTRKHMAKNFDLIVGRVTDKKYGVILKEMRAKFEKTNNKITVNLVRKYLKDKGLSKYYPYCTAFCMDLSGRVEIIRKLTRNVGLG